MATLNIRNLPDPVHKALRVRAAQSGRSMEAEARTILTETVLLRVVESESDYRQRVDAVREQLGEYLVPAQGDSIVDELIAERRAEALKDDDAGS